MPVVLRQPRVPGGSFQFSAGGSFQFSGLFDRCAPGGKRLNMLHLACAGLVCRHSGNSVRPVCWTGPAPAWAEPQGSALVGRPDCKCFGNSVRPSLVGSCACFGEASGRRLSGATLYLWVTQRLNKLPFVPAISLPHKVCHAGVASQRVGFMKWASGRGPGFWPWRLQWSYFSVPLQAKEPRNNRVKSVP